MRMRERLRDKLRILVRTLTAPGFGHFKRLPLPPALFFLYSLILPVWRLTSQGLRLVRRRSSNRALSDFGSG
jgi:hypothetical protein